MVVIINEGFILLDKLQKESNQIIDLSKDNGNSEIKYRNSVGYSEDVIQLNTENKKSIEECSQTLSKCCNDSIVDIKCAMSDHSLQNDFSDFDFVDIYLTVSNEISESFDPSTDKEKASKEIGISFIEVFHFQRVDYCEIPERQHQNDQNTTDKTVFRYSGDDDLSVLPSMVLIDSIEHVSNTVLLKDNVGTDDQPKVNDWKTKGQISSGRSSKDSVNDWKENNMKSGKRIGIELAAHTVEIKDCFIRDYSSRLLLAPEMTMLLLVLWIHVISISSKISVRITKEKHHVSNQVKLKCQLCVDKNRATSRCNTCRKNICSFCKMYHEKVWTVMNHDVHPLQ